MNVNIRLPILTLEAVETVSKLNEYIRRYSDKNNVVTRENIDEIFSSYNGNVIKYLELSLVLLMNISVNKSTDLYGIIDERIKSLINELQPEEYQIAINCIIAFTGYTLPEDIRSMMKTYIDNIRMRMANENPVSSTESSYIEHLFGITTTSDIHFSAVLDAMLEMCQEVQDEMVMNESIATTARKVKDKVTNTIVNISLRDKEMSEKLNEKFNRYLTDYKENKKVNAYEKIVKDTFNLSRMLKNMIGSSIVALFVPGGVQVKMVAAVLTLLAKFCLDKRTEDKHKKMILADLKFEKTIVEEKIKDAESKNDNKAKYQLMRTANQIQRAIDRIQFGLAQK